MNKTKLKITTCVLIVLSASLFLRYLFRVEQHNNPSIGIMYYSYRWGYPDMILADTNRDGKIDARASVRGSGSFEARPHTYWEDRDSDGIFEIKMISKNDIYTVWIDTNKDGIYEKVLQGEEARIYYRSITSPSRSE